MRGITRLDKMRYERGSEILKVVAKECHFGVIIFNKHMTLNTDGKRVEHNLHRKSTLDTKARAETKITKKMISSTCNDAV